AGEHIKLGDSLDTDLGDVGRVGDDATVPTVHADDHLPLGATDHLPRGTADHLPGGSANHMPGGASHDHGAGPTSQHHGGSHETKPGGQHDPESHRHSGDDAHLGSDEHHAESSGHDVPGEGHADYGHHIGGGEGYPSGPDGVGPNDLGGHPEGVPLDPQPDWHGESAGKMRHYRRPALDVSHLPHDQQLLVLEQEASRGADGALDAASGPSAPGENKLKDGCVGSFLHDNVITVHSSTTKMHGQKLPHTHQVLEVILKKIKDDFDAGTLPEIGVGHGKCAEISLISDRLHQLEGAGAKIQTVEDARRILEGSAIHTRRIGDFERNGIERHHNDYLPPCGTCKHVLPAFGIHAH
ncbi:YwqJ-related putative deaminase, partial [Streptomyces yokosukanensis]